MIQAKGKLADLLAALEGAGRVLILTHNHPDPDAIASAFALRHILAHTHSAKVKIGYGGNLGRAENRAMVRLLRIPIHEMSTGQAARFKFIALVDGHPKAKNVLIKKGLRYSVVIDHHISRRECPASFADLRVSYGATCSILAEYIRDNDIPLDARVATALYYGIKSDIADLGRDASDADFRMLQDLYSKISLRWLTRIERARVPRRYYRHYAVALANARIVEDVIVSDMGRITNPETVAELADFFLKTEGVSWTLCLGVIDHRLQFSLRTVRKGRSAGAIAAQLVGRRGSAGGHDRSAGGTLPLEDANAEKIGEERHRLVTEFCRIVGRDFADAHRLVPEPALADIGPVGHEPEEPRARNGDRS
ncbi:MAG: DHH family phosphoesterase [Deltaproteobacteria bacterium]|nr:DHH family phosphoesterase [Deltaproteobacteria bacterium]